LDIETYLRLATSDEFPGVRFGTGVMVYGTVRILPGTYIGDYSIIGVPTCEDIREREAPHETLIGQDVCTGVHCVIHSGAKIGHRVLIQNHCSIGSECAIGNDSRIQYAAQLHWKVKIGTQCVIGGFCCDRSSVGDGAIMLGKLIHKLEEPRAPWDETEEPSPMVEKKAVVGFDALLIGSITVRFESYVAAGAIVTKDVLPGSLVIGTRHYTAAEWRTQNSCP